MVIFKIKENPMITFLRAHVFYQEVKTHVKNLQPIITLMKVTCMCWLKIFMYLFYLLKTIQQVTLVTL